MSNEWTDRLAIAKQEIVGPSFWSFLFVSVQRKPVVGWSQIVFRRNQFVAEILPADTNNLFATQNKTDVKVRERDVIVYVYRGLRPYHLAGTVFTNDKHKKLYEIDLILEVHHPVHMAQAYYQGKDPVWEAINQVKLLFEQYASSQHHDQFPGLEPPFEDWNTKWLDHLGIAIQPKGKTMFREDPYHSELERMEQEKKNLQEKFALEKETKRMQDEIRYEQEKSQKEYELKKKSIERDFARQEAVKDQIHKICSDLLQAAADEMKDALRERVHEGFEKGQPTSEIWDELYAVLYAVGDNSRQITLEQRIMAITESMHTTTTESKRNPATSA